MSAEAGAGQIRDVFWVSGYATTSLDDLVAATGLSRPSLYAAFGDKHAVNLRALRETGGWAIERIQSVLKGHSALAKDPFDLFIHAMDSTLAGDAGANGTDGCPPVAMRGSLDSNPPHTEDQA